MVKIKTRSLCDSCFELGTLDAFYRDVMGAELVEIGLVGRIALGIRNSIVTGRTWMVNRWQNFRSCRGAATYALSGPARFEPPLPI